MQSQSNSSKGGETVHISLNYDLNLSQRVALSHALPLYSYSTKELELVADYILYADKLYPTQTPNKYTNSKTTPTPNPEPNPTQPKYTSPKPKLHLNNPIIQQYAQSIEWLGEQTKLYPDNWKLRQWKLQHTLDMGIANAQLHPTFSAKPSFPETIVPEIDLLIDLTNSFHISKLIEHYSALRQSEHSKLYIDYLDTIIDSTPMYPWQKHLLHRRIDGVKQITIGRELGEHFGKIVTPSTMSQALRTLYRQIAINAEKQEYIYYIKHHPAAYTTCRRCGELKLKKYDFYPSKPSVCKQCATGKK